MGGGARELKLVMLTLKHTGEFTWLNSARITRVIPLVGTGSQVLFDDGIGEAIVEVQELPAVIAAEVNESSSENPPVTFTRELG